MSNIRSSTIHNPDDPVRYTIGQERVFNLINDPIIIYDANHRILFLNDSTEKILHNFTNENITLLSFTSFINTDQDSYLLFDFGLKLPVQSCSEIIWVETPALFVILKKSQRLEIYATEETGNNGFHKSVSDMDQVMLVNLSLDGIVTSANDRYNETHKINEIDNGSSVFVHFKNKNKKDSIINQLLKPDNQFQPVNFEVQLNSKISEFFWERWTILPLLNAHQEVIAFQGIGQDITENKWNEKVEKAINEISQATVRETKLADLFYCIQKSLNGLMPADNMYIALIDESRQKLAFPFFKDQYDPPPPSQGIYQGLTGYVIKSGKPLLISDYSNEEIAEYFGVLPSGASSVDWLGVPLKYNNENIGAIVVQTYDINTRYNRRQVDFIKWISSQIAQSIFRTRAEESLRENEERYRALFESSQDAIFLEDQDGSILDVNEAATTIYGYTKKEFKRLSTYHLVPEKIHPRLPEILKNEYINDRTQHFNEGVRKNGEIFPVFVSTCKVKIQGLDRIVVNIRDLQKQQANEERLHLQSTALEAAANAVIITDPAGIITWVNPAFTLLTGYQANEVIGQKTSLFKSGVYPKEFYENLWNTIQRGQVWHGEMINKNKENHLYYEEMTITPVKSKNGSISHFVSIKQNITERKQKENELEAIAAMTTALRNAVTQEEILDAILGKLMELIQGGGAIISLYQPLIGKIVIKSGVGEWAALTGKQIPLHKGITGYIIETGDVFIDNNAKGNEVFYFPEERNKVEGIAGAPLIMQDEIIGSLIIGTHKPIMEEEKRLLITMSNLVAGVIYRASLLDQVQDSYRATIQGWARALEIREQEKKGHSENVVRLTELLARKIGFKDQDIEAIINGAYLHDIGKMGIPDDILFKPGKFNEEDWNIMKQHPVYARTLLENIPHLGRALDVPYYHHEYWDGSGYPEGLKGNDIPIFARIFALVDVWDALLTPRIYRPAWSVQQVIQYIELKSGKQFDPLLVPIFLETIQEIGLDQEKK